MNTNVCFIFEPKIHVILFLILQWQHRFVNNLLIVSYKHYSQPDITINSLLSQWIATFFQPCWKALVYSHVTIYMSKVVKKCKLYLWCSSTACWFHILSWTCSTVVPLLATQPTSWLWSILDPYGGRQLPFILVHLITNLCGYRPNFVLNQLRVGHHYFSFFQIRPC